MKRYILSFLLILSLTLQLVCSVAGEISISQNASNDNEVEYVLDNAALPVGSAFRLERIRSIQFNLDGIVSIIPLFSYKPISDSVCQTHNIAVGVIRPQINSPLII